MNRVIQVHPWTYLTIEWPVNRILDQIGSYVTEIFDFLNISYGRKKNGVQSPYGPTQPMQAASFIVIAKEFCFSILAPVFCVSVFSTKQ